MSDEQIKLILEILSTVAIITASSVAIYGINAWRKEFQGKRKIELAEEVLALFYEARDAISAIRSPLGFQGEGSTRKPQDGETPQQKEARDRAYVVFERLDKRRQVFNRIDSLRYQFMARFGIEKAKPFADIRMIVIEIKVIAQNLAEIWSRNPSYNTKEKEEYERIIWEYGKDDQIKQRIDEVISDIEEICKPIIMA